MSDESGSVFRQDVSRETSERLEIYEKLLRKWNPRINLVARDTLDAVRDRHFEDSAQLLNFIPPSARKWVDLGSGGGFPGMVIAIMARQYSRDLSVTLVESDQRKAAFLRTVSRETSVPVSIHTDRGEKLVPQNADVVSARALAPLPRLLPLVERHLAPNGIALLPKGRGYREETDSARVNHRFSLEIHRSQTDADAVILVVGQIENA